jgi:quinolinate synthase
MRPDGEIEENISRLRRERNAVILAHNYQRPEVQEIADFTGDSLGLARKAAGAEAEVIVFCGVHFMAETSAIINPEKITLLPDPAAGCPLADTVTAEGILTLRRLYPEAAVVTYVNSSAAAKAESDYCCTSGNAVQVVEAIEAEKIIFTPDKNLAAYVEKVTGRNLIAWQGCCPIHDLISAGEVEALKRRHPGAPVIAHPECRAEVLALADFVASTSGMGSAVGSSAADEFIILTEAMMLHPLMREFPERRFFFPERGCICEDMKLVTLEKVEQALRDLEPRVTLPEDIRVRALKSVERMIEIG